LEFPHRENGPRRAANRRVPQSSAQSFETHLCGTLRSALRSLRLKKSGIQLRNSYLFQKNKNRHHILFDFFFLFSEDKKN